jgi:hypothetical protein
MLFQEKSHASCRCWLVLEMQKDAAEQNSCSEPNVQRPGTSDTIHGLHALQHSLQDTSRDTKLLDLPSLTALSKCIQGM